MHLSDQQLLTWLGAWFWPFLRIGTALMGADGTITVNIRAPQPGSPLDGVVAVRPGDANYARIKSHLGGISPGEKKPVAPFC